MIDPHRLAPFAPGSPMRSIMDRVQADRAALPSGVAPGPFELPPKVDRTDDLIAASLAGGMIAAGGKVLTAEEAIQIWCSIKSRISDSACAPTTSNAF